MAKRQSRAAEDANPAARAVGEFAEVPGQPVVEERLEEALADVEAGRVSEPMDNPERVKESLQEPEPEKAPEPEVPVPAVFRLKAPDGVEMVGIEGRELFVVDGHLTLDAESAEDGRLAAQLIRHSGFVEVKA